MMKKRILKLTLWSAALCALFAQGTAMAVPIGPAGPWDVIESFENEPIGPNNPSSGGGYSDPGVNGPYTFNAGMTLVGPIPNPGRPVGVIIGDWNKGFSGFGLLGNGAIGSAADVPFGAAYLALDDPAASGPILIDLGVDASAAGAFVTGTPGMLTLTVYDAAMQFIETHQIASVNVAQWGQNFLGISAPGIRFVEFGGDFEVLDNVQFRATPTPGTLLLLAAGLIGLGFARRRKAA